MDLATLYHYLAAGFAPGPATLSVADAGFLGAAAGMLLILAALARYAKVRTLPWAFLFCAGTQAFRGWIPLEMGPFLDTTALLLVIATIPVMSAALLNAP